MTDQEPRRGLDRLFHLDWLPSRIFGGRMRTSTFILIVAWILTYLLHTYLNPEDPTAVTPPPSVDTSQTEPYVAPSVKPSTTTPVPSSTEPTTTSETQSPESSTGSSGSPTPTSGPAPAPATPNSPRPRCRPLRRRRPFPNLARRCRHRRLCRSHPRPRYRIRTRVLARGAKVTVR